MSDALSPLAASAAHLVRIEPFLGFDIGEPRTGDWFRWADIVANGNLDRFLDEVTAGTDGRALPRVAAGSLLGCGLVEVVVARPVATLIVDGRAPVVAAESLFVHRHPDGYFDRVAYATSRFLTVASDPAAGDEGAIVATSEDELIDSLAQAIVECLQPVLTALRQRVAFGLRGLWGFVADEAAGIATMIQRADASEGQRPWATANTLIDAVARHAPQLRNRPTLMELPGASAAAQFAVRGTCCLWYKTPHALDAAAEAGCGYCSTCPLLDEPTRITALERALAGAD